MQFNLLATLSLITVALASPIAQDANPSASAVPMAIINVPTSILTVLETAVPASWYEEMLNSASRDSVISEIQAGTLPAWYNSLPASVKAWATSAGHDIMDNFFGAAATGTATATVTGDAVTATVTSTAGDNGNERTHAVAALPTPTAATTSGSKAHSSGSSATETVASTSKSSTPSSSTSTGGAPIATAGVAMSFAGAAGLLGLALAL